MSLRAGISPCPNDVFVFSGWLLGETPAPAAEFAFLDVQTLNLRAGAGEFDLVKVSTAHVPRCPGYRMLGCGGALGRGCGPLLLTGGGPWDPRSEVLVPGEHTTANLLFDHWTSSLGIRPPRRFLPFDAVYRELRAREDAQGVVIHEKRFTWERDGLSLVRDLGAHWEESTGHPIPLGALLYREREGMPSAAEIERAVRASLAWAWENPGPALALCARHAQDMDPAVIRAHVDLYVNEYTLDAGNEGAAAAEFLWSRARREV